MMWNTFGSIRDQAERRLSTVRESALAAAQAAQGVLQAAAEEDTASPVSPTNSNDGGWEQWPEENQSKGSSPRRGSIGNVSPRPPPPPVPLHTVAPPPPPATSGQPLSNTNTKRRAPNRRYVVTGTATTAAPPAPCLPPPKPTFAGAGTPKSPVLRSGKNSEETVAPGNNSRSVPAPVPAPSVVVGESASPTSPATAKVSKSSATASKSAETDPSHPKSSLTRESAKEEHIPEEFSDWLNFQNPLPLEQEQESAFNTSEWTSTNTPVTQDAALPSVSPKTSSPTQGSNGEDSFFSGLAQSPTSAPENESTSWYGSAPEQHFSSQRDSGAERLRRVDPVHSASPEALSPGRQNGHRTGAHSPWKPEPPQQKEDVLLEVEALRNEVNRLQSAHLSKAEAFAEQDFKIQNLRQDLEVVEREREVAVASKEVASREVDIMKREVLELKDEVADSKDDIHRALAERDDAKKYVQELQAKIEEIGLERDAAVEAGQSGLREARTFLESTDSRQSALIQDIESLRESLERSTLEKNEAQLETEQLRLRHRMDTETLDARVKESERRLQESVSRVEALEAERDEALAGNGELLSEHRKLMSETQTRAAELRSKEKELLQLEKDLRQSSSERDTETVRLEALASQLSHMKETMEAAILERNQLHDERNSLTGELEKALSDVTSATSKAADAERQAESVAQQKQESDTRVKLLQAEVDDLRVKCETVGSERNALIRERTASVNDAKNLPDSMKALTQECEAKTKDVTLLQRQLKSAATKIAKVTAQRNTVLRQRDDAGSRLNAAAGEFTSLRAKMNRITSAHGEALKKVQQLQDERDDLRQKIGVLSANATEVESLVKSLDASRARTNEIETELVEVKKSLVNAEEAQLLVANDLQLTKVELKRSVDVHTVLTREFTASQAECEASSRREKDAQTTLNAVKQSLLEANAALVQSQSELRSLNERFEIEKNALQSELEVERSVSASTNAELESARSLLLEGGGDAKSMRKELESGIQEGADLLKELDPTILERLDCQAVHDPKLMKQTSSLSNIDISRTLQAMHVQVCQNLKNVILAMNDLNLDAEKLRIGHIEVSEKNSTLEQHMGALNLSLADATEECTKLKASERAVHKALQQEKTLASNLRAEKQTLVADLESSRAKIEDLQNDVDAVSTALAEERSTRDAFPSEEKQKLVDTLARASEVVNSMWSLVQSNISAEIVENIAANGKEYGESDSLSNVGPMALQGLRVLSVEMKRLREVSAEYDEKLAAAQREIESIWEKTELAESERDSARASRDRLERESKVAHERGFEEAAQQFQDRLADLEQDVMVSRQDVSILQESLEKSENESTGLRSLCSKLTSQFNSRTNELDEAEEKLAYLNDHVASLEEDLELAQQRAQSGEQQSGEAHRIEVDRLSSELAASQEHTAGLEEEVIKLRDETEKAKSSLMEATLVAETHKTAEQNLQIAIEQLEAEQESMINRKTLELQRRLEEALSSASVAEKKISAASGVENKLALRDEEITELRTALGRLADERVELKLELEKSLSRLNHPDGGEQLVDRRVVRQLLVNYFRVGMARRRDILELMSRMLGFSDTDLVTVGLKRVALMDRIGSLVQPPDLDGNSLPPLGTVSDKWIEFLMKETEEEEEDF